MISSQGLYRQGLGGFSQQLGRQALGPFLQMSPLRLSTVLLASETAHLPASPRYHLFHIPRRTTSHAFPVGSSSLSRSLHRLVLIFLGLAPLASPCLLLREVHPRLTQLSLAGSSVSSICQLRCVFHLPSINLGAPYELRQLLPRDHLTTAHLQICRGGPG